MPSWSKRPDAGDGRNGDGAKRTKAPTREEKLTQLILSIGKQTVHLEKAQREVANTVIRTVLSPADDAHAEAGTRALQAWQDEVAEKAGVQRMGPAPANREARITKDQLKDLE